MKQCVEPEAQSGGSLKGKQKNRKPPPVSVCLDWLRSGVGWRSNNVLAINRQRLAGNRRFSDGVGGQPQAVGGSERTGAGGFLGSPLCPVCSPNSCLYFLRTPGVFYMMDSGYQKPGHGSVTPHPPGRLILDPKFGSGNIKSEEASRRGTHPPRPRNPPCDIPSGCCSFTGPWTVTCSSLRMLRRVAAFCRPLRPVLLLVSFPRSRSPVGGVLGLC